MPRVFSYKEFSPQYDNSCYLAPGAQLIGKVELGEGVNIWHNTVLRGDVNLIKIGVNTNVQDLSMLHVTEENPLTIGENVSIGHKVILHGCTIGSSSLIGMGATVLDQAVIGKNCLVGAGSVVTPRKVFEDGMLILGSPARAVRKLNPEELDMVSNHYKSYKNYAKEFMDESIVKEVYSK